MSNLMRVLVVGATGAQGGSVARHLLRSGRYQVRCLTRRPQSAAAMALERQGPQVVGGDLDEPASLRAALRDCEAVFGVTDSWGHFERQLAQGRNLVDAIIGSGVQHAVLSTLPHTRLLSGGRLEVLHFDSKAQIEEYARSANLPATYIHVAFHYENFLNSLRPGRQPDGSYALAFPQGTTPLAAVAAADVGGVVTALLAESFWYRGKVIGVVGDDLRCEDYAQIMSRVLGRPFVYRYIAPEAFAALDVPHANAVAVSGTTTNEARADSDLATDDMEVQATVTGVAAAEQRIGVIGRKDSTATRTYISGYAVFDSWRG